MPGAVAHITCQGNDRNAIFRCDDDRRFFLGLFDRYLGPAPVVDPYGREYSKLTDKASLHAFSPMTSHYHVIARQEVAGGITDLMHRVQTSYGRYVNSTYGGAGPVFRSRFTSTPVLDDDHLKRAILYTHLQHLEHQLDYAFNSHKAFMGEAELGFLSVEKSLEWFGGQAGYVRYANEVGPDVLAEKIAEAELPPGSRIYRPVGLKIPLAKADLVEATF